MCPVLGWWSKEKSLHSRICRVVRTTLPKGSLDIGPTQDQLQEKPGNVLVSSLLSFAVDGVGCTSLLLAVVPFWFLKASWPPSVPVALQGSLAACWTAPPLILSYRSLTRRQVQETAVENKHSGVRQPAFLFGSFSLLGRCFTSLYPQIPYVEGDIVIILAFQSL